MFPRPSQWNVDTILKFMLTAAVVAGIVWYGLFQARLLIAGPTLALSNPQNHIFDERIITISGTAANITNITLNGRAINTSESGDFSERLVLQNGYTIMVLQAEDRYGRTATIEESYLYKPNQ